MMKKLFEKEKTEKKEARKEAVAHGQDTKNARGIIGGSFRGEPFMPNDLVERGSR